MTIFRRKPTSPVVARMHVAIVFLVVAFSVACGSKPTTSTNVNVRTGGGNSNQLFSVVSPREIRAVNGARFEEVVGTDGRVTGVKVVALDDEQGPTLPCECETSACAGTCTTKGFGGSATCSGNCSNSEGLGCGGCAFRLPPQPPGDGSGASSTTGINANNPPVVKDQ